ncbi:MAG TPA: GAF domain-containing protein [Longimicrobiales bacterium]|nr:GAF domain-containing protein [Longimicrobiales bacterium]
MATPVRDPRDSVTPEAFRVADHLIGIPLARPWRRLAAILVDLLLVAILVALLDAVAFLVALAAAFLVFRLSRGSSQLWYQRFYRRGLGCFGAFLVFVVVLFAAQAIADAFDDDPSGATVTADSSDERIEGLGVMSSALSLRDGIALASATRAGERDTLATRIVERLVADGLTPAQLRSAVRDLADDDVMPATSIDALEAAVETTSARLEGRQPRSLAAIRAADSAAAADAESGAVATAESAAVAAAAESAAVDSAPPVDSALVAARDSMERLAARLRDVEASLAEERETREATEQRLDTGAFRWLLSSVADEMGLSLGWLGLYFTAFTVLGNGQTPGKRLLRLRVIRLDGRAIGWWTSLQRFGGYAASVLTGLLGFAEMFWDDNRQALQDKLVHTVVIQEPKQARGAPEDDATRLPPAAGQTSAAASMAAGQAGATASAPEPAPPQGDDESDRRSTDDFRRTVSEYEALNAVGQALLGILELEAVLAMSANEAAALVGGDGAAVLLLGPEQATVEIAAATKALEACTHSQLRREGAAARLLDIGSDGALFPELRETLRCRGNAEIAFPRAVSVPLRARGESYGALVAFGSAERAPFDRRDRDMLAKLATFAAIAIDNARHFREEQQQIRQLKTLSALAGEMAQLRSASELFQTAVRIIHHEFGFEHVSILLLDEARAELVLEAVAPEPRQPNAAFDVGYRQSLDVGILGHVARTGRPYLAQDTARDALFHVIENWDQAQSELVLPVKVKDRIVGVINLETQRPNAFQESDLEVMQALADLIGVGLENARLVEDSRQAERQRLQAEKLATIGQLVAGLAHEINNPLAGAQSAAELLLGQELSDDVRESLEVIRAESARAALIVRKLLDFSRPQDAEFQLTDVIDAIEAALSLRAYEHRVQDITVVRKFTLLPPVRADVHRLQQVFLNLIVNAEHAMAGQTRPRVIDIECSDRESIVEICITDTGLGIDESDLDAIFDPFFTTKPVGQGTGLGLSVSYGIIRELGGSIRAVPHRGGARFVIRLPAVRTHHPVAMPSAAPVEAAEPETGGPISILFVDDEASLRRVAQRYLSRLGHHVELAADGEEALQLLQTHRFDVIVTDLRMPRLGGEELYQRMAALRVPLQDRFLFMSGDIVNEKTRRFLANTGRPYLHKPFELKRLASLIRTIADEPTS